MAPARARLQPGPPGDRRLERRGARSRVVAGHRTQEVAGGGFDPGHLDGRELWGFYRGRWASASASVEAGREIWINSCASCHPGPEGVSGGTKSGRPFPVLEAFAGSDRKFFTQYV